MTTEAKLPDKGGVGSTVANSKDKSVAEQEAVAKKLAEPLKPSAERSKTPGNVHPVPPGERELTPTGNTTTEDALQSAYTAKNDADNKIQQIKETSEKLENDPLYQRDQEIFRKYTGGGVEVNKQGVPVSALSTHEAAATTPPIGDVNAKSSSQQKAADKTP